MSNVGFAPQPILRGKHYCLRAVIPPDYAPLFAIFTSPPALQTGRLSGQAVSYEEFCSLLWQGVIGQFVVAPLTDVSEVAGLVTLDNFKQGKGVAYFSLTIRADLHLKSSAALEGTILFLRHCFDNFDVRKIYAETTDVSFSGLTRSLSRFKCFREEGRLQDDTLIMGSWVDLRVCAFWRHLFYEEWPSLERLVATTQPGLLPIPDSFEQFLDDLKTEIPNLEEALDGQVDEGNPTFEELRFDSIDVVEVLAYVNTAYALRRELLLEGSAVTGLGDLFRMMRG